MQAAAAALLLTLLVDPGRVCGAGGGGGALVDVRAACRRRGTRAGGAGGRAAAACRDAALLREASRGVARGAAECAHQFRAARWNCTLQRRSMRYVLLADTRETAFVNAIAAAGAAHAVARACAAGALATCACAPPAPPAPAADAWRWGGCADDVRAGVRLSRDLLDAPHRLRTDLHALLKLHNYNAGRSVVRKHARVECKCHGLSGSCVARTCWQRVPTMRQVGARLKESYDRADKVMASNDGDGFLTVSNGGGGGGGGKRRRRLLYSEESPSYCAVEVRRGSLGTRGRVCAGEACGALCCGRGHVARLRTDAVNCRCRFRWCCNVTCDTCLVQRRLHTCL